MTGIPSEEINDEDDVSDLLALDSLQMTELWLALQERFGQALEDGAIRGFGTVAAIAEYLSGRPSKNPDSGGTKYAICKGEALTT